MPIKKLSFGIAFPISMRLTAAVDCLIYTIRGVVSCVLFYFFIVAGNAITYLKRYQWLNILNPHQHQMLIDFYYCLSFLVKQFEVSVLNWEL